jgi:hypothetical protein
MSNPAAMSRSPPVLGAQGEGVAQSRHVASGDQDGRRLRALGAEELVTGPLGEFREEAQDLLGKTGGGEVAPYPPVQAWQARVLRGHRAILPRAPGRGSRLTAVSPGAPPIALPPLSPHRDLRRHDEKAR